MKQIEINNITKTFALSAKQRKINKTNEKHKVAVDGLSFFVNKGEIYGLLGSNGAGKTTTLRILSTLINSDGGEILVNGINIKKDPNAVRKNIAFLTSDLQLDKFFTPNYLFDYYSRLRNIDEDTIASRKKKLFDIFGINDFAEVKVSDLSTGMKQKASLAISICHDPEILIFDEPTNGLDVITAKIVTDFILKLKEEQKTIIISTHIFSLVEKVCDRVGIIHNGIMLKEEEMNNLREKDQLENLFFKSVEEVSL